MFQVTTMWTRLLQRMHPMKEWIWCRHVSKITMQCVFLKVLLITSSASIHSVQSPFNLHLNPKRKKIMLFFHVWPLYIILILVLNPLALLPSTLSKIFPEQRDIVTRYIRLVKMRYYEKVSTTCYCPREGCQMPTIPQNPESLLVVCSRCTYPFCKLCRASWHGPGNCKPYKGLYSHSHHWR